MILIFILISKSLVAETILSGTVTDEKGIGLPVDNPYFSSVPNVPQRGRFSPFLFKGTSFSSGRYSAQYGQAMSSALILETQDLPEESMTNIGIISVGANIGHTKRWKKTAVGIFGGYTDLQPYYSIVEQNRDWQRAPHSINGSATIKHQTSKNGMLKGMVSYSVSNLTIDVPDTSDAMLEKQLSFKQKNNNFFSTLGYRQIIFKKWTVYAAGSLSSNENKISIDEFPLKNKNNFFSSRLSLSRTLGD